MRRMGDPERMAERLRYAMECSGMTAAELSRRAQCHKSSISMYLQGTHTASRAVADRMARVLEVNTAWLMGFDVPMNDEEDVVPEAAGRDYNQRQFIRVGDTVLNLAHVVTIRHGTGRNVTVLLDTGTTIEGEIRE